MMAFFLRRCNVIKKLLKAWPRRLLLLRISKFAIAITLALSIIIVGLSIYMNNVGNFVVSVEKTQRLSITLSENNDFVNNATSILYAKGIADISHATYGSIPDDINDVAYGNHNDDQGKQYSAYTFFLKNTSPVDVSYSMSIVINQLYKNVDRAIRVLVITDGRRAIYAKRDSSGNAVTYLKGEVPDGMTVTYETVPFVDDRTVCFVDTRVFKAQATTKYTIVMWLEGYDPDCIDDIKGGAIRLTMNFSAT